jgi:hypothetical protein
MKKGLSLQDYLNPEATTPLLITGNLMQRYSLILHWSIFHAAIA